MAATELEQRIEALIAPPTRALGFTLVRVRFADSVSPRTLQIMAERAADGSMTVEDCVLVNNTISTILDVEDPIDGEYNLEVSSPGMDRPLVKAEDFKKYAGYKIKLTATETIEGRKRFKGTLKGIDGEVIQMEFDAGHENAVAEIPLHKLDHAQLVITDEMLRQELNRRKKEN